MRPNWAVVLGCVLMAFAVGLGAVGSHALPETLSGKGIERFDLAVRYHSYHALGLVLVGVLAGLYRSRWLNLSMIMMFCGLIIFSGGLYALVWAEIVEINNYWIRKIIPIGGMLMISSWLGVALSLIIYNRSKPN